LFSIVLETFFMTETMISIWRMGRTRLTNQLPLLEAADMAKRLHPGSNSIGWLLRHMAEVEMLFAKNVFSYPTQVKISTVGKDIVDKGNFTDLSEAVALLSQSAEILENALRSQKPDSWDEKVTTEQFGTITKAEALSRITTHTAWHAGQLAMIKKYASMA